MQIRFRCLPELEPYLPRPTPAKRMTPEWLKDLALTAFSVDLDREIKTVKACPPVIDAMTAGFMLPLVCDLKVSKGVMSWDWKELPHDLPPNVPKAPVHFHLPEQIAGTPYAGTGSIPFKFRNFWTVALPPGYSLLYTHPFNRRDLPFRSVTGLVDNDVYGHIFTHVPSVWIDPEFDGVLPAGTPISQCLPIKREALELDCRAMTEEERQATVGGTREVAEGEAHYRKTYRAPKT